MRFLLSCFDPFNKASVNQSQLVAEELRSLLNDRGFAVDMVVLPTVYDVASAQLLGSLTHHACVVSLGEGDHRLRYESRAYNLDDCADVADNAGVIRISSPISPASSDYYDMALAFEDLGYEVVRDIPGLEISESAGRFVCNNLSYHLSLACAARGLPFLFFHVPKHTMASEVKDPRAVASRIFEFLVVSGVASSTASPARTKTHE